MIAGTFAKLTCDSCSVGVTVYGTRTMTSANVIERAFQIAPECESLAELKRRLIREGYFQVEAHLSGRQIKSQIMPLLNAGLAQGAPKRC
jgi:hypothetical protein